MVLEDEENWDAISTVSKELTGTKRARKQNRR